MASLLAVMGPESEIQEVSAHFFQKRVQRPLVPQMA